MKLKLDNNILGVISIFLIVLIVYLTLNFNYGYVASSSVASGTSKSAVSTSASPVGQAAGVESITGNANVVSPVTSGKFSCKLLVSPTSLYDANSLSVMLEPGASTFYRGYTVIVEYANNNGCVVNINTNKDFIAVGQIERLGQLYVTVKEVLS